MSVGEVCAYAAALVDGEGSIQPATSGGKRKFWGGHIIVANTEKALLDPLLESFGGTLRLWPKREDQRKPLYQWWVSGQKARQCATLLFPYIKHPDKISRVIKLLSGDEERSGAHCHKPRPKSNRIPSVCSKCNQATIFTPGRIKAKHWTCRICATLHMRDYRTCKNASFKD